jgi:hypothetical protein
VTGQVDRDVAGPNDEPIADARAHVAVERCVRRENLPAHDVRSRHRRRERKCPGDQSGRKEQSKNA